MSTTDTPEAEKASALGRPAPAGSADLSADVMDWLASGRRGISSETMVAHFEGIPPRVLTRFGPSHPFDNSDFMRCVALLDAVPQYRERLHELKDLGGPWIGLVNNWRRFEELLERQQDGDKAAGRELYDSMKAIGC